jgi:mannose-6-phosphate isomerase
MSLPPLTFHPYLRPVVWGGRQLGEALGKPLPPGDGPSATYGESWEVSDHPAHRSVLRSGAGLDVSAGLTLRDLMEGDPAALVGEGGNGAGFPWLVKYLDARDLLSVQVHPDERAVARLWPGEGSKTEAWFILAAQPGARVWAGLKEGVDEPALRRALANGEVADCLHSFEPSAGDCLFLPAGTVHAVGGGVLIAEVQQSSDATFRLHDWGRLDTNGRPRALHVEQALACIDWSAGPVRPVKCRMQNGQCGKHEAARAQRLVNCAYFHLDYVEGSGPWELDEAGRLRVLMTLRGHGRLMAGGAEEPLALGETVLIPASVGRVEVVPDGPLGALVATLPGPSLA